MGVYLFPPLPPRGIGVSFATEFSPSTSAFCRLLQAWFVKKERKIKKTCGLMGQKQPTTLGEGGGKIMGNKQACLELTEMSDACALARCVERVQGIVPPASASASDTWLLTLSNAKYNGQPVRQAFLKFWIAPNAPLDFELRVYAELIRPLIDLKVSPHFVKFYARGERCTFSNLV